MESGNFFPECIDLVSNKHQVWHLNRKTSLFNLLSLSDNLLERIIWRCCSLPQLFFIGLIITSTPPRLPRGAIRLEFKLATTIQRRRLLTTDHIHNPIFFLINRAGHCHIHISHILKLLYIHYYMFVILDIYLLITINSNLDY